MWETGLICLQCARSTFNSGLELFEWFAHPAFLAPQTTDEAMVAQLDDQHRKLQQGFSLRDTTDASHQTLDITPVGQTTLEPAPDQGLALLVSALSSALQPTDDTHLTTHRQLQEIADNGWVVRTRVLARVLGQSNSSLHSWGEKTERLGFSIERTGSRGMFRVTSAVTQAGYQQFA